jgi:hypothetical protein
MRMLRSWFALWRHRQTLLGLITRIADASDRQNETALCNVYGESRDEMQNIKRAAREINEVSAFGLRVSARKHAQPELKRTITNLGLIC